MGPESLITQWGRLCCVANIGENMWSYHTGGGWGIARLIAAPVETNLLLVMAGDGRGWRGDRDLTSPFQS